MSPKTTESNAPDDGDRLHWEVEKLRAETESLRRPAYLSPTTLISVAAALVALLGAGFQYQINQVKAARADLEASQNAFRAEQTRSELALLEGRKVELAATIDAMQAENINMAERLADIRAELAKAEDGIQRAAANAASPEARQTLTQAQRTVATLQAETNESEQLRSAQTNRLSEIREQILPSEVSKKLYVGNLPFTTNETELMELFGRIGKVDSLNLVRDRETGRVRGFAFVEMATDAAARQAIEQLDGQDFFGRRLTVNKATPSRWPDPADSIPPPPATRPRW